MINITLMKVYCLKVIYHYHFLHNLKLIKNIKFTFKNITLILLQYFLINKIACLLGLLQMAVGPGRVARPRASGAAQAQGPRPRHRGPQPSAVDLEDKQF